MNDLQIFLDSCDQNKEVAVALDISGSMIKYLDQISNRLSDLEHSYIRFYTFDTICTSSSIEIFCSQKSKLIGGGTDYEQVIKDLDGNYESVAIITDGDGWLPSNCDSISRWKWFNQDFKSYIPKKYV